MRRTKAAKHYYDVFGERFTNPAAAERWWELNLLQRAGEIRDLARSGRSCTFTYTRDGEAVTEAAGRRGKYNAEQVQEDGRTFDSKREHARWQELCLLERQGVIRDLRHHVTYPLHVNGAVLCRYEADFVYTLAATGREVVEDSKGVQTPVFKLKAKHMRLEYGIEVKIT